MAQKLRIALAGSLVLAAVPVLGYEEAFVAPSDPNPPATVVQVGEYHESLAMEVASAPEQRQSDSVVAGVYTEQFADTGVTVASATARSSSARLSAKR